MVISVIQQGKGVLHFSGELDSYNLQLIGEHAAICSPGTANNEIRIALDSGEREALMGEGIRVLDRLATAGFAISILPRNGGCS